MEWQLYGKRVHSNRHCSDWRAQDFRCHTLPVRAAAMFHVRALNGTRYCCVMISDRTVSLSTDCSFAFMEFHTAQQGNNGTFALHPLRMLSQVAFFSSRSDQSKCTPSVLPLEPGPTGRTPRPPRLLSSRTLLPPQ